MIEIDEKFSASSKIALLRPAAVAMRVKYSSR